MTITRRALAGGRNPSHASPPHRDRIDLQHSDERIRPGRQHHPHRRAQRGDDGLDPATVDLCLITHFHADHFFDIVFLFLEQGLLRARDSDLVLIGPKGFQQRVEQLFELAYPGSWPKVKTNTRPLFVEFDESGGEWSGNGYAIRAVATQHSVPSLGYLITDEAGTRLGYTGDTVYCPAVEDLARDSSALVLDTSFHHSRAGHMGLDDVEALADRWPALPLLTTHRDDDVTTSTRPTVLFPADGATFRLNPHGLAADQREKAASRPASRTPEKPVDLPGSGKAALDTVTGTL